MAAMLTAVPGMAHMSHGLKRSFIARPFYRCATCFREADRMNIAVMVSTSGTDSYTLSRNIARNGNPNV